MTWFGPVGNLSRISSGEGVVKGMLQNVTSRSISFFSLNVISSHHWAKPFPYFWYVSPSSNSIRFAALAFPSQSLKLSFATLSSGLEGNYSFSLEDFLLDLVEAVNFGIFLTILQNALWFFQSYVGERAQVTRVRTYVHVRKRSKHFWWSIRVKRRDKRTLIWQSLEQ